MPRLLFLLEVLEEGGDLLVPLVDGAAAVGRRLRRARQRLQRLDHGRGRPTVHVVVGARRSAGSRILGERKELNGMVLPQVCTRKCG